MNTVRKDLEIVRPLAERYAGIASLDVQGERIDRYYKTNAMEEVRPVVLIDEVPWGEIRDDALECRSEHPEIRAIEDYIRRRLYQWDHFQVDLVIPPVFGVGKRSQSSGIGLDVKEVLIKSSSGTYAASHEYHDQLKTDEDLEKLQIPTITYDPHATDRAAEAAEDLFSGLMPVEVKGGTFAFNIWDRISVYRGVDNVLLDLAMRPEFMHRTARKFMEIGDAMFAQLVEQDLLSTAPLLLHCTPASAHDLPARDFAGTVRRKDVWGRCSAQIFAAVSPEMHDQFDLVYNQKIFGDCGLLYYGCCEPMHGKIDILRKRFPNLRKISITPWADPEAAARNINGDYVLAAKPNPAFVNSPTFNPQPVDQEIRRYLDVCRRHKTVCEFVLKDISTIANNPNNLTQWAATVNRVIDEHLQA